MCGIAGIISSNADSNIAEDIESMIGALHHRGPDGNGRWKGRVGGHQLAFGHTRLTILDLTTNAQQPMIDPVSGCVLVYNGEIYNFHDVRDELRGNDQRPFNSTGDTEVLLRSYTQFGINCVKKLRGMFAFCVFDPRSNRLVIARDHLGIKPLYYSYDGQGHFAFASEVRALLRLPWIGRQLDLMGLMGYLAYGSVQGSCTLVSGVHALLPGHMLTVDLSEERLAIGEPTPYWALSPFPVNDGISYPDAVAQFRETLSTSVRQHLVSDVPVGAFLSGGIDSSAVVALMAQAARGQLHTLTVAFDESEYDESSVARAVAQRLGTQHSEVRVTGGDFLSAVPLWLGSFDQPSVDGANTWIISQACKRAGIKVAVSGLGADELLGGYSLFYRAKLARKWGNRIKWIPAFARRRMADAMRLLGGQSIALLKAADWFGSDCSNLTTYLLLRRLFLDHMCRNLLDNRVTNILNELALPNQFRDTLSSKIENGVAETEISLFETKTYLVNTLLRDSDQMGMAHSVEIRVPFIDWRLAEMVFSLPESIRTGTGGTKSLLRDATKDYFKPEWFDRPKMGFVIPFDKWLRSELKNVAERELARLDGLPFRPNAVRQLWKDYLDGAQHIRSGRILALLTLAHWMGQNGVEYRS
ncbi:MAG: asparagine synthase (glutamine-hydrolyzing) [Anaerolineae bacterium]